MTKSTGQEFDVLVAGAGPAGLMAACLLKTLGQRVVCVGPRPPSGTKGTKAAQGDLRTTALFQGAIRLIDKVGAWAELQQHAAPLAVMRIVDCCGRDTYPSIIDFPASEIGDAPFGYNIANRDLTHALAQRAGHLGLPLIDDQVANYEIDENGVQVRLARGAARRVKLVVGADGRGSPARAAAGISATTWDYQQTATVFTVTHQRAHEGVSTEFHRADGPLTFIPLPGKRSAVNWLEKPETADQLAALGGPEFAARLNDETNGLLGPLDVVGGRASFPISGLSVSALARSRVALIADAAHVNPPIGAQGLNLGFRDIAVLAELIVAATARGRDPGAPELLSRYCRARAGDVITRKIATDLLNRSLLFDWPVVRELRGVGLTLLAASATARRLMMRQGLVTGDALPALMRP
ncbi:MAG: FAD-dependent monooxygenase [Alphaproteobacteria bacterium]